VNPMSLHARSLQLMIGRSVETVQQIRDFTPMQIFNLVSKLAQMGNNSRVELPTHAARLAMEPFRIRVKVSPSGRCHAPVATGPHGCLDMEEDSPDVDGRDDQ
jgi:hypothetical protein